MFFKNIKIVVVSSIVLISGTLYTYHFGNEEVAKENAVVDESTDKEDIVTYQRVDKETSDVNERTQEVFESKASIEYKAMEDVADIYPTTSGISFEYAHISDTIHVDDGKKQIVVFRNDSAEIVGLLVYDENSAVETVIPYKPAYLQESEHYAIMQGVAESNFPVVSQDVAFASVQDIWQGQVVIYKGNKSIKGASLASQDFYYVYENEEGKQVYISALTGDLIYQAGVKRYELKDQISLISTQDTLNDEYIIDMIGDVTAQEILDVYHDTVEVAMKSIEESESITRDKQQSLLREALEKYELYIQDNIDEEYQKYFLSLQLEDSNDFAYKDADDD